MQVRIVSIVRDEPVAVAGGECVGYRGCFACPSLSGRAVFVPYGGDLDRLFVGASLAVETDYESVSGFEVAPPDAEPRFEALPAPGDYAVVGTVVLDTDGQVFDIETRGFFFAIDVDATGGVVLEVGWRVSFAVRGLSLWDEGI